MLSTDNLEKYKRTLDLLVGKTPSLLQLVKELQGFRMALVDGAGANTDIAIAGIEMTDTLKLVLELPATYAVADVLDRTSIASITSAGNIQLTSSTASNKLLVVYYAQAGLFGVSAGADDTTTDGTHQLAGVMTPALAGATHQWELIDSPLGGSAAFDDDNALDAVVTLTGEGAFTLRLRTTHGGITASDEVVITHNLA